MREILFKAKSKNDGMWQEGQIIKVDDRYFITYDEFTKIEKSIMYITGEIFYDLKFICEVIPKTICEYTGLTDKNGVKIFENDIVKCLIYKYKVYFKNGCFMFENLKTNKSYTLDYLLKELKKANVDIEVIGNIFDEEVK